MEDIARRHETYYRDMSFEKQDKTKIEKSFTININVKYTL